MTGVKFLFRVTLRRHDLVAEIFHLKEPVKVPLVLSQKEIKRILAMAPSLKAKVMLSLAYGCGMRAGEVVRLKVGDIDSAQEIIRIVQSKGRKDRNVMLPADILGLLREWWKERPTGQDKGVPAPERVLFPGYRGKHLSARQLSRLFKQTAREAGITKPVTLHTLRHSFATHLLERGVDIRVIQALLGHTKLTTTARYASVATGMIAAVDSPLDDLKRDQAQEGQGRVFIGSHAWSITGGRGYLPRPWCCLACGERRAHQPEPVESDERNRALPHSGAWRSCRAVRRLRA